MNSRAVTKIQAVILTAIIVVAAVVAGVIYVFWLEEKQQTSTIKIGVVGDLDMAKGKHALQGAVLAAEEINAEGGILGRQIEVIGEDSDSESSLDVSIGVSALIRLITYRKVDYLISSDYGPYILTYQDVLADHKKICLGVSSVIDAITQRVLDNYDKYKYFFRVFSPNSTSFVDGMVDNILTLREYTGFNKVAYLAQDLDWNEGVRDGLDYYLPEVYGFDLVYRGTFAPQTIDFSSYFAAVEASGAEILVPLVAGQTGILIVKEWFDRQSPMVLWGVTGVGAENQFWNWTDGKCEHTTNSAMPTTAGYPITNKTLLVRDAYVERWGETPTSAAASAYDALRFILSDAIKRAGTTETDAVIEALEETEIETSLVRRFVFTQSHDVRVGAAGPNRPGEDYMLVLMFQWQANGTRMPVYPQEIMEEAGATYTYPDWPGPWD